MTSRVGAGSKRTATDIGNAERKAKLLLLLHVDQCLRKETMDRRSGRNVEFCAKPHCLEQKNKLRRLKSYTKYEHERDERENGETAFEWHGHLPIRSYV